MKKRTTLIPISVLVVLASLMSLLIALPLSATHIGVTQAVTLQVLDAPSSGGGTVQSTTVSGVQYVSNTTTAHDWVKVTVVDDSHTLDDALTTTATVTNISTNLAISGGITLTRSTSTPPTTPFVGEFRVAATATSTTIGASNGHTIRVAHGLFPKQLVVDGKLPAGTGFSPTSGTVTKARTITLSGDITDTPSSGIPTVVVGGKVVPNPAAVQINLKTAANSSTDMAAAT